MPKPAIKYAKSSDVKLAYQVTGQGALDIVLVPGFPSNLEILWEDPGYVHLLKRLQTFARVILFDRRGTGLSDRPAAPLHSDPAAEAEDIRTVMDAAGCGRAALIGASEGAGSAVRFAVQYPGRLRAPVLYGASHDIVGATHYQRRSHAKDLDAVTSWGAGALLAQLVPGRADDKAFAEWWARLERLSVSPTAAQAFLRPACGAVVLDDLPKVSAPSLLLHRTHDAHIPAEHGKRIAAAITGSRMAELPGCDHPIWTGDVDAVADVVEEFLTGERKEVLKERVLAALLVAQILGPGSGSFGSDQTQHRVERIELFREACDKLLTRHGGEGRWGASDRIEARFPGVARATGSAAALRDLATAYGLGLGQAIHVAEIDLPLELMPGNALDITGRIAASARRPDILLSRLASDFVSGAGLQFVERPAVVIREGAEPVGVVALASERHLEPASARPAGSADMTVLSPREREVLALVAEGLSNPRIAVQLGLSEHTVKRHVANILLKLDLPTRSAVAGLAARRAQP